MLFKLVGKDSLHYTADGANLRRRREEGWRFACETLKSQRVQFVCEGTL